MLTQLALVNGMKSAFGGTSIGAFFGFSGGGLVRDSIAVATPVMVVSTNRKA